MVGTVFVVDVCFVPAVMFFMVVSADCVGVQWCVRVIAASVCTTRAILCK